MSGHLLEKFLPQKKIPQNEGLINFWNVRLLQVTGPQAVGSAFFLFSFTVPIKCSLMSLRVNNRELTAAGTWAGQTFQEFQMYVAPPGTLLTAAGLNFAGATDPSTILDNRHIYLYIDSQMRQNEMRFKEGDVNLYPGIIYNFGTTFWSAVAVGNVSQTDLYMKVKYQ